jgi:Concanavalin A-like lectin/glucanases superfamily
VATVTKAANAHTVVATGWTSPANCYSATSDSVYATILSAKNATYSGDYGFPAFTTSDIPDGSTINSVTVYTTYGVTAATTGMLVGLQARRNTGGATLGSEITSALASMADANVVATGATLTDLRTANEFRVRARVTKGSTTTASTGNIDRLYVTVGYTLNTACVPGAASMTTSMGTPTVAKTENVTVVPGAAGGVGASYDDTILAETSLVSYWQLNEASGYPQDSKGANHVLGQSGTPVWGQTGVLASDPDTSIYFGTTACGFRTNTNTAGFPTGSAARTLEYWIKTAATTGYHAGPQYGASQKFGLSLYNGQLWLTDGLTVNLYWGSGLNDGAVHHFAAVVESATSIRGYVDGADMGAQTVAGVSTTLDASGMQIAAWTSNPTDGTIEKVALYNAALTSTRVAAHYSVGHDGPAVGGGLVLAGAVPAVTVGAPANITATPDAASLTATGAVPSVVAIAPQVALPAAASMSLTGGTPTVMATANVLSQPGGASMTATGSTPAVIAPRVSQPGGASLTASGVAPPVALSIFSRPTAGALTATGSPPALALPVVSLPSGASLAATGATPTVVAIGTALALPTAASLTATGSVPSVVAGGSAVSLPTAASMALSGATPTVALSTTSYAATILADSPIRYYRAGESSGTTADNATGNATYDGTYVNSPTLGVAGLLTGDADTAMGCTGLGTLATYLSVPAPSGGLSVFSVEFLVKPAATYTGSSYDRIFSASSDEFELAYNGTNVILLTTGAAWVNVATLAAGETAHFVATYNGTTTTVYKNGVSVYSAAVGRALDQATYAFGAKPSTAGSGYKGTLDEPAIYDYVLTSTQDAAHYAAGTAASPTIVSLPTAASLTATGAVPSVVAITGVALPTAAAMTVTGATPVVTVCDGMVPPFGSRPTSGAINLSWQSNVTISNLNFADLGAGVHPIFLAHCSNVTVVDCDFANVLGCVYAEDSTNIAVVESRYSNVGDGTIGSGHSNFVQLNRCSTGYIARNLGIGGDTEDIVNLYQSDHVVVEDNHFEGTDWSSTSGSGIAVGDGAGSSYNISRRNILVNPGQVGTFIAGGIGNSILDNIVIGEQRTSSNVGIYVWNLSGADSSGHTVAGNRVHWLNAAGTHNSYWDAGNSGTVDAYGNTWGDDTLNIEDYRVNLNANSGLHALPTAASMALSGTAPAVTTPTASLPTAASMTAAGSVPSVVASAAGNYQPTPASMALSGATPAILRPVVSQPTAGALTTSLGTPAVLAPRVAVPGSVALTASGATPTVKVSIISLPTAGSISTSLGTPAVALSIFSLPTAASLTATGAVPAVAATSGVIAAPSAAALALTATAPSVALTNNWALAPSAAALTLAMSAPLVVATTSALAGRTLDQNGDPIASCTVDAFTSATNAFYGTATSDSSGRYSITVLPGVPYFLVAYKGDEVFGASARDLVA